MQIHPYVGSHWKEEIRRLSPQKNKNFMPTAKFSLCRGLIAVDSVGRVLMSLVALSWTAVPGFGGTDTDLWPFAAARWGRTDPCAAGRSTFLLCWDTLSLFALCYLPGARVHPQNLFCLPTPLGLLTSLQVLSDHEQWKGSGGKKQGSFPSESGAASGGIMHRVQLQHRLVPAECRLSPAARSLLR